MEEHQFDDERSSDGGRWYAEGSAWSTPDPTPSEVAGSAPIIEPADPAAETQRLIDELTATARAKAAAVAVAEAELVDAVAALRPFEGKYLATWRQWISWQCGLTSGETNRVCRLAEKLVELPLMDEALRAGKLSAGVTEVLARDATPATESEILAIADVATGRQLQQLVRDHRRVRRSTKASTSTDDDLDPATAPSQLSYGWGDDGRHHGSWNLRPDEGATLEAALEAALANLRPSEADIDGGPTHDDADPSAETTGSTSESAESGIAEGTLRQDEKPRCRRSDALIGLADAFLAGEADDGLLPESTQIILHRNLTPTGARSIDGSLLARLPDLRSGSGPGSRAVCDRCGHVPSPAAGRCDGNEPDVEDESVEPVESPGCWPTTLPGCGTLDPRIADLLSCDALVITVEMIAGFPASVPTAARTFNRSQRRAMRARDRHCQFPGCRRTRHLHAHHTKPYGKVHRTSVADGVLLCAPHHALIHLRGHTIALGLDHQVTVTRADGSVLRGVALPPPAAIDPPAVLPDDRRLTGTGEPLTHYGRGVIVEHWLAAEPPDPPDPPDPSESSAEFDDDRPDPSNPGEPPDAPDPP